MYAGPENSGLFEQNFSFEKKKNQFLLKWKKLWESMAADFSCWFLLKKKAYFSNDSFKVCVLSSLSSWVLKKVMHYYDSFAVKEVFESQWEIRIM